MSKDDAYCQFPISLLQAGVPLDKVSRNQKYSLINDIVSISAYEAGRKAIENGNIDDDRIEDEFLEFDIDDPTDDQRYQVAGDITLGLIIREPSEEFSLIKKLERPGGKKLARIKLNLALEARDSDHWTWRDFAILCGVYAGIGARKQSQLSFEYIGILASGYSSKDNLLAYSKIKAPSRHIVRYSVRKLAARNLFAYACPDVRHNYYANSCSSEGLQERLIEEAKRNIEKSKGVRDSILQAKIKKLLDEEKRRAI